MSAQSLIPDPDFMAESLISTATGAHEGQTLLFVGVGELKNEIRLHAYGMIDEDPLTNRHFYFPAENALQEVTVRRVDEVVSGDSTEAVFAVSLPEGYVDRQFTFTVFISHD